MNKKEILTLKKVNGLLEVARIPIEDSSYLVNQLNDAKNNPNKTLMDLQSLFLNSFRPIQNYYNYTYPYGYGSSYISGASKPEILSYAEYTSKMAKDIADKIKGKSATEIESIKKQKDAEYKATFVNLCTRYIQQQMMYNAFQKANNDETVKMCSRENIGWSSLEYKITDDIKVCVYTNFGYGYACYFTLTVSYKGMVIAPFSHVVKYYKANMTDIIRCTRDYYVSSDSWNPAFEFVKDFANQSLRNPQQFVEDYLMNEIREMMAGLKNVMANPRAVINMFRYQSHSLADYHNLRLVSPMSDDEKKRFDVFPNEMPVIFKAEKMKEAYNMLKRLNEIGDVLPEVKGYASDIVSMIMELNPEIEETIGKIEADIDRLSDQKKCKEEIKGSFESQLEPFEKALEDILDTLPKNSTYSDREAARKKFESEHSEYVSLKNKISTTSTEISDLNDKIRSRESLVSRLKSGINDISDYDVAKAA